MDLSPYVKGLCPYCGNEFNIGDCAIVSSVTGKVLRERPQGLSRLRALIQPSSLDGPKYTREIAQRQCPHCGNLLPYNFGFVANLTIAVVGDTYSGKSTYIVALVHELKKGKLQGKNGYVRVTGLTPKREEEFTRNYIDRLFKHKLSLGPTQTVLTMDSPQPLIYELIIDRTSERAKHFNLILYDLSGEEFVNAERLAQFSRHILNANGIIFLADPMAVSNISQLLPAHLQPNALTGRSPTSIFTSFISLFERYKGLRTTSDLFTVPIVIMLSKSDLLKYFRRPSEPYHFMKQPLYDKGIVLQDLEIVDHEVREILQDFGESSLLQATKAFPKVKFLATSATGYPPNSNGMYPAIEPIRCLDPLLWILWQLRIIDAE